jgi:hypothetical protein
MDRKALDAAVDVARADRAPFPEQNDRVHVDDDVVPSDALDGLLAGIPGPGRQRRRADVVEQVELRQAAGADVERREVQAGGGRGRSAAPGASARQQLAGEGERASPPGRAFGRAQPRHQRAQRQQRGEPVGAGRQPDRDVDAGPMQVRPSIACLNPRAGARDQLPFARRRVEAEDAHRRGLHLRQPLGVERDLEQRSVEIGRAAHRDRLGDEARARARLRIPSAHRFRPGVAAPPDQVETASRPRPARIGIVETAGGVRVRMRDRLHAQPGGEDAARVTMILAPPLGAAAEYLRLVLGFFAVLAPRAYRIERGCFRVGDCATSGPAAAAARNSLLHG